VDRKNARFNLNHKKRKKLVKLKEVEMKTRMLFILAGCLLLSNVSLYAAKDAKETLKDSFLGAGSGTVGAFASGAKAKDVWKGALAGTAVNVVGGALVDGMSGERVTSVERVQSLPGQDAYSQGYQAGYSNGFQAGYVQGLRDGVRDATGGYRDIQAPYPQQQQRGYQGR
jgi:hypothetical protein